MKYLILALAMFSSYSVFANSYEKPNYCAYYDVVDDPELRGEWREENGDDILFSSQLCSNKEPKIVTISNMLDNYFDVRKVELESNKKMLKDRMINGSVKKIMESAYSYQKVFGVDFDRGTKNDLKKCLRERNSPLSKTLPRSEKKHSKLKNKERKELQQEFYRHHMIKALITKKHFDKLDKLKKKYLSKQPMMVLGQYRGCNELCQAKKIMKAQELKIKYNKLIADQTEVLHGMLNNNPLLFDFKNKFKLTDWFNSELSPSPIFKTLVKGLPNKITKQIESMPDNVTDEQWYNLVTNNAVDLEKHLAKREKDSKFKKTFEKRVSSHINELQNSAEEICSSDGENLHHFPLLIDKVLNDAVLNETESNQQIVKLQSAHCMLLREDPDKEVDRFTLQTGIGLGVIVIGVGAQFVPLIGNGIGTTMIYAGSGLLLQQSVSNYIELDALHDTSIGMHAAGWEQYDSLVNARDQRKAVISDIAIDLLSFGAGAVVSKMNKAKIFSKGNTASAKFAKENKLAFVADDPASAYKRLIWDRHEALKYTAAEQESLSKMTKTKDWLMRVNNNKIPAHLKYGTPDKDELGMIRLIAQKGDETEDVAKAFDDLDDIVKDYMNYHTRLDDVVDQGFTDVAQIDVLKPYIKGKKALKWENFKNGKIIEIELPIIKDGKATTFTRPFSNYNDLMDTYKGLLANSKKTFSQGMIDESFRKSSIFKEMDKQAELKRTIEITREKLQGMSPANMTAKQKEYLVLTRELIEDSSLAPRLDAIKTLEHIELGDEVKDVIRGKWIQGYMRRNSKYDLAKVAENSLTSSKLGTTIKTMATTSATIYFSKPILFKLNHMISRGEYGARTAETKNKLNVAMRTLFEATTDEFECAKSPRGFSFKVCFYERLTEYLGPEIAMAREDPEMILSEDRAVREKVREYASFMLRLRQKERGGEIVTIADAMLSDISQEMAVEDVVRYVSKIYPDDKKAQRVVYALLNEKDPEKQAIMLEKLDADYDAKFADTIAFASKIDMASSVVAQGRIPAKLQAEFQSMIEGENNVMSLVVEDVNKILD